MTPTSGRLSFGNANELKLGLFGANCSSGRAATTVPERWSGTWDDNLALAQLADASGIDFMLPIGRWKGYGGITDFEGETFETITWACGLLAQTKRLHVFGTVHTPLIHPVYAAKAMVTADHISHGRFGLNIVCGWNADEFEMFGVAPLADEDRYVHGKEWIDAIMAMWTEPDAFTFDGRFFKLKNVRAKPKPYDGDRPLIMNAGTSDAGRKFGAENCDALFTPLRTLEDGARATEATRATARAAGREVHVFTSGYVVCRPTDEEAREYHRYYAEEHGDWEAVDRLLSLGIKRKLDPAMVDMLRIRFAGGHGGYPIIGSPDTVARMLAELHAAGFTGYCFSFVNYLSELPYFADEVLPRLERLGIRARRTEPAAV